MSDESLSPLSAALGAMRDAMVGLQGSMEALQTSNKLADRVRANQSHMLRIQTIMTVLVVLMLPVVIFLGYRGVVGIHNTKKIIDTNTYIASCVSPTGQCYRDQQARTTQVLGVVQQSNEAVALCAQRASVTTLAQMNACVSVLLQGEPISK